MPFVRVTHGEVNGLTEILETDASVAEVELFGKTDDERFYRLVWNETAEIVGYMVNECAATVQEATASDGEWHLRALFPDRDGLSAMNEYAQENGVDLDMKKIYGTDDFEMARYNLTELQYEALAAAAEQGYYEVPRETDSEELAAELNISHQALSERLRRATKSLVVSALAIEGEDEPRNSKL